VQSGDFLWDGIGAGMISDDLLHASEHNLFLCGDEIADDFREEERQTVQPIRIPLTMCTSAH
jgi:hypothetical protein